MKRDEAVTLLMMLSTLLLDEHAEGLAVAIVKGGLLEGAAQHSASMFVGRHRRPRKLKVCSKRGAHPVLTASYIT